MILQRRANRAIHEIHFDFEDKFIYLRTWENTFVFQERSLRVG